MNKLVKLMKCLIDEGCASYYDISRIAETYDKMYSRKKRKKNSFNSEKKPFTDKKMEKYVHNFIQSLKSDPYHTLTENGAITYISSGSYILDLFGWIGALRGRNDIEILDRFYRAWKEDRDLALRIMFYARDVRGGLGERHVFRTILNFLAEVEPDCIRKNIDLIPFYGRYDDLMVLLETPCEIDVLNYIRDELAKDTAALEKGEPVSLLAKWLPSENASSPQTRYQAGVIMHGIGMHPKQYRKTLSALRSAENIIENYLREKDYSFNYSDQPSKAMLKYHKAFFRHDEERYSSFLDKVNNGEETLHTGSIMPCDLVKAVLENVDISPLERKTLDTTWNALEDFTDERNALAVIDGSGSMYWDGDPLPIHIALSLGLYFAEHNQGMFKNQFITFSMHPQLVEIKGNDFVDRVKYCSEYNECANTDIEAVFDLILQTAVENQLPQSELPEILYIISDMEFDACAKNAEMTNFECAKQKYEASGYKLPSIVFWNVQSRNRQMPVRKNDRNVALVSGSSSRIFSMVMQNELDPYQFMMNVIGAERYAQIRV